MYISLNDVKKGKKSTSDDKLETSRKISGILKQMPQGTVSIVGPGSEEDWNYAAGVFKPVADMYMDTLFQCGHPIFNPEHVYNRMQMNMTFSEGKQTGIITE